MKMEKVRWDVGRAGVVVVVGACEEKGKLHVGPFLIVTFEWIGKIQ